MEPESVHRGQLQADSAQVRSPPMAVGAHNLAFGDFFDDLGPGDPSTAHLRQIGYFRSAYVIEVHQKGRKAAAAVDAFTVFQLINCLLGGLTCASRNPQHPRKMDFAVLAVPLSLVRALICSSRIGIFERHAPIIKADRHVGRHAGAKKRHAERHKR